MIYYGIYAAFLLLGFYEIVAPKSRVGQLRTKRIIIGEDRIEHRSNFLCAASILFLIVFASIRWDTGTDFNTYENLFNKSNEYSFKIIDSLQLEWTFRLVAKTVSSFTQLLTVYATLSVLLNYSIIKQYAEYCFVSILVFFSTLFLRYDMGIIRQGAALALIIYSVKYALNNQWKPFFAFVLLASLFHSSALIFSAVYFIVNKKIPRRVMLIIVGVCIIMGFTNIWSTIFNLLSRLPIPNRYIGHLRNDVTNKTSFSIFDFQNLVLLTAFLYFKKDNAVSEEDKLYNSMINIYFLGTCLFYFFKQFPYFGGRGLSYFFQFEILLIPAFLKRIKNAGVRMAAYILVGAYAFRYVYGIINSDLASTSWMNSNYVPYKTIFNK